MSSFISTRLPRIPLVKSSSTSAGTTCDGRTEGEASDETLLVQAAAGKRDSLALLFERYDRLLRSVALRILGDGHEAEDLVQDLFIFIQRKSVVFDASKSSARSWIVQMAYHRAISRRRYLATRQFYSRKELDDISEKMVAAATTEDDYSAEAVFGRNGLERVIESLSEDQRQTLCLHFFEGYTLAEIGEILGQPHGNVRHHYYRGLAQLRKYMAGSKVRDAGPYGK